MGKRKVTEEVKVNEDLTVEESDAKEQPETPQAAPPQEQPSTPESGAPELYGNNPTAQEIEDFKARELVWRRKLGL